MFAWLPFLKNRQFAHVKRKSTDKCAIGGGRNHRLSLQHGLAPGLSSPRKAGQQAQKRPGMAHIFVTCAAVLSKDLQNVRLCVIISSRNAKQEILYYATPRGSKQPAFPASVLCGAGAFCAKGALMPLSVKTKEHFRRRMALAGPKWGALVGGAVALAVVIMFTTSALHFVTVPDTHGGSTRILTVNQTEAAVLAQAGVAPLGENDRIVTSETPDGELMQVLRAYTVPVTADGQTQEIITTGATTRDLLTQAGLTYTEEDYLTPAADETVPEGGSFTLQRVSYVEYTEDETVPSEVEEIPTSL